ncbi:MAG TPA: hypothetical protein VGV60_08585 [Candidatus Polarisedimenticolia bacterium]|jgi:hypothetical protein|nr:hypothetical protein [Candidatus Polarisedimenticolia bacterium]
MKVSVVLLGLVWPVLTFGQQLYTNADLAKFDMPGAYSNKDLRRLPPSSIQPRAATGLPPYTPPPREDALYQRAYDALHLTRVALQAELDFEMGRIAFSESALAGDTGVIAPRLGYRAAVAPLVLELQKRVALLDRQMDSVLDAARRAGAVVDQR